MSTELDLVQALSRLVHLLALSIAPAWLSPDPAPASGTQAALAGAGILVLLIAAARFARAYDTVIGRLAAASWWVVVAGAAAAVLYFHGERAPLGRAVPFVAPLVWGALALTAAAAAERLLRPTLPRRQLGAAVLVLAIGAVVVTPSWSLLRSPERMWRRALALEPAHAGAVVAVTAQLRDARDHEGAIGVTEACIAADRASCVCHSLRVHSELRLQRREPALEHARAMATFCGDDVFAHAALAQALSLQGLHEPAMAEVARGLGLAAAASTPKPAQSALHYAHALVLDGLGRRPEALREAELAIATGGGRDARLLAAAIAISTANHDDALRHIEPLVAADKSDPDALYNRALVADMRKDFNTAREGYLATLRAEPSYAAARFNLALLTWRYGIRDEAKNHVRRFVKSYPNDPRSAQLLAMIGER